MAEGGSQALVGERWYPCEILRPPGPHGQHYLVRVHGLAPRGSIHERPITLKRRASQVKP